MFPFNMDVAWFSGMSNGLESDVLALILSFTTYLLQDFKKFDQLY